MKSINKIISGITPPVVVKFYENLSRKTGFFGNYSTWEDARRASKGYDSEIILYKVKDALLKVKKGEAVYERDSVLFDKVQYSWPLLAALLLIASRNGNKLNLVDFGGSLGSSYFQNRILLAHLRDLKWNIVEQNKFVECGKQYFEDDHLKFYYTLDECLKEQRCDAILLSSVLQYLEKPYDLLGEILSKRFTYIIFDRTYFLEIGNDRITVQKVSPKIYSASYPAWFFNRDKFLSFLGKEYELLSEFEALSGTIDLGDSLATDRGFIFRKI